MLHFLDLKTHPFPRCAVPEVSMRLTGAAGQTAAATRVREASSRPPHEMSARRDCESAGKVTVMQKSSGSWGTDLARIKPMSAFEEKAINSLTSCEPQPSAYGTRKGRRQPMEQHYVCIPERCAASRRRLLASSGNTPPSHQSGWRGIWLKCRGEDWSVLERLCR